MAPLARKSSHRRWPRRIRTSERTRTEQKKIVTRIDQTFLENYLLYGKLLVPWPRRKGPPSRQWRPRQTSRADRGPVWPKSHQTLLIVTGRRYARVQKILIAHFPECGTSDMGHTWRVRLRLTQMSMVSFLGG